MDTITILLIILAAIIALGIVVFQYFYKAKKRKNLSVILSFLRFIALFGLLLLLINPKFSKEIISLEKPNLIVLSDNSSSVEKYKEEVNSRATAILENVDLNEQFNVDSYNFDSDLGNSDSLNFVGRNTNIAKAIASLNDIYANTNTAIVLMTDGNQTFGQDYGFSGRNQKFPIYPIVIGDTTTYEDLRIDQVNVNRFAFLKNKYPIEVYATYEGKEQVNASLSILSNGKPVYRENVSFSNIDNTKVINTLLEAGSVGPKSLRVEISPLANERNKVNNQKNIAIEVIDEKINVAIVSDIQHPDIGAIKKAAESNEQRSITIKRPNNNEWDDIDLFILYQPNPAFKSVFDFIRQKNANSLIVIGTHTELRYLNNVKKEFQVEDGYPIQEVIPVKSSTFSKFDISEISFDEYPPLNSNVGPVNFSAEHETILDMEIKGLNMGTPLMSVMTKEQTKTVLLFGENIWKWRVQSYRDNQDFGNFDEFVGKLMVYLSDNKSKDRLQLDYKSVYEGSNSAKITASYFDEAFVFDPSAVISVNLKGKGVATEVPMLLKGAVYEADLSNLGAGEYNFMVTVKKDNRSKSGSFTILDFDVEQQFPSSNFNKLNQLALDTNGKLFFPSETNALIENVTNDQRFRPIQSSTENVVSLIDFRILLGIIALTLALEWFIRKYNGLI